MQSRKARRMNVFIVIMLLLASTPLFATSARAATDQNADWKVQSITFDKTAPIVGDVVIVTFKTEHFFDFLEGGRHAWLSLKVSGACPTQRVDWDVSYMWPAWTVNAFINAFTTTSAGTITAWVGLYADSSRTYLEVQKTVTLTVLPPPKPTVTLTAAPAEIWYGDTSTLTWTSANAVTVTINNVVDTAGKTAGVVPVKPTATITYTATATNSAGTGTATATVTVKWHPPEITTFSATPTTMAAPADGGSSTITWEIKAGTSRGYQITTGSGTVIASRTNLLFPLPLPSYITAGSKVVSPTTTTVYTIKALGGGGTTTTKTLTITVNAPRPDPPTCTLTPSKTTITLGGSATLTLSTKNAASVSCTEFNPDNKITGIFTVTPTFKTTYTAIAYSSDGRSATGTATIDVTIPAPTISFSITPTAMISGTSATLSWSVKNADSISILSDGDESIDTSTMDDSATVTPVANTQYILTVIGKNGITYTKSCNVTIGAEQILTLTASNENINSGESTTLHWESANIGTLTIDNGVNTGSKKTGDATVSPTSTTTYTANGIGVLGATTASVTVTVNIITPTVTLSLDKTSIKKGESAVLTWSSTDITSVNIDQGAVTGGAASGHVTVSPTTTTTYAATATGASGTATNTITLTVSSSSEAPTIILKTDSVFISKSTDVKISWTATNADTVTVDHDVYSGNTLDSSAIVTVNGTTTFTATATNSSGGMVTATITVTLTTGGGGGGGAQDAIASNLIPIFIVIILIVVVLVYYFWKKKNKKGPQPQYGQKQSVISKITSLFKKKKQPQPQRPMPYARQYVQPIYQRPTPYDYGSAYVPAYYRRKKKHKKKKKYAKKKGR